MSESDDTNGNVINFWDKAAELAESDIPRLRKKYEQWSRPTFDETGGMTAHEVEVLDVVADVAEIAVGACLELKKLIRDNDISSVQAAARTALSTLRGMISDADVQVPFAAQKEV